MLSLKFVISLAFLLTYVVGENIDEIVRIVQYDYDHDKIKSIITFEDDYSVMRVKENDYIYPIELGKVLVYMKKYEWKDVQLKGRDVTIILEQNQNPQFFFFRVGGIIPSDDGTKGYIPSFSTTTVKYGSTANVFSIFQEGTTTQADRNADAAVGVSQHRIFPGESRKFIEKQFIDVYEAMEWFKLTPDFTAVLQSKLFEIYDGLLANEKITFDDEVPYDHIQTLTSWKEEFEPLHLEPEEVIYANSDESFHFWIDENRKDAYIVDVGSLFFTNGLEAVIDDISEIETLYIVQTHFHSEHIQGLAPLINRTDIDDIRMIVSTGLNLEFVGWLLENFEHIVDRIYSQRINFIFVDDDYWVQAGALEAKLLLTNRFEDNRIKHFISNTSPVFRDKNGNYKIFSGDLQSPYYFYQPEEEFFEMVVSSISQIFEAAEIPEGSNVDYYFGIGLYYWEMLLYPWQIGEENRVRIKDLLSFIYEYFPAYPCLDLQMIHITNGLGFNMALHPSYSKKIH